MSQTANHLINQALLFKREFLPLPRLLDILLSGRFGLEHIKAHGRLDSVGVDECLRFRGCIAELLGLRNVLIERERLGG